VTATLYEVLGVAEDADAETIGDAYRERVKETHPDVSDHPNAQERLQ
jgi:molecular chaperone DnaJ